MPEIGRFLGIIIAMYYNDYPAGALSCEVWKLRGIDLEIETGGVIRGHLPPRVLGLVQEWRAELHRNELLQDWKLAEERKPRDTLSLWSNDYDTTTCRIQIVYPSLYLASTSRGVIVVTPKAQCVSGACALRRASNLGAVRFCEVRATPALTQVHGW